MKFVKGSVVALFLMVLLGSTAYASDLYVFDADIQHDSFSVEQVSFETPVGVDKSWYPLREASKYLPISVDWDNDTREVVVDSDAVRLIRPFCAVQRYGSRRLAAYRDNIKIVDGVTYCSPKFLNQHLDGVGFLYNNSVYCYTGDNQSDAYVKGGNSPRFVSYVNAGLYELYLKSPDDYRMVKDGITGGVQYVSVENSPYSNAVGYVYAQSSNPVCYIIGDTHTSTTMASLIAHEAMHIHQEKTGGENTEEIAKQYERQVLYKLLGWQ